MYRPSHPCPLGHRVFCCHRFNGTFSAQVRQCVAWLGVLLLLSYCPRSSAALLAYEGFEYTPNTTSGSWQNVGSPVAGADAPIIFTHTNGAGSQQRLYRVRVD